jgi:hypothetical protein
MFSGVFITEEVGVEDKWSGCHKGQCTDIAGGIFEHVPEICPFHKLNFCLVKSKTSTFGTARLSGVPNYRALGEMNFAVP